MGPLNGLRVIELAGIGPTPFGAMMLADMGAEVITIERAAGIPGLRPQDATLRNRRSIVVNLKKPEGVELVLKLCESADALIEGYRPGVAERLGLGPEAVQARNPKLVYARMTGWGQTGPLAQTVGHDINYIAITGALEKMGRDAGRPVPPLNLVGDFGGGGLFMAYGVVCALLEAQKSGKGQVVDAAIVDGAATLMAYLYAYEKNPFFMPYKNRGSHLFGGSNHFYNTFECADGKFVSVGALEAHFYLDFIERLGVDKAEFEQQWLGSPEQDISKVPALEAKVIAVFKTKTRDEWVKVFEGSNACFAPVLDIQEAAQYPHNVERKAFIEVDGLLQHAPAPRFSRSEPATPIAPRVAGEDTNAVLSDFGYNAEAVAALREAGVVAG
ncbi:MAG: CoA transferase [Cellvibrionales bacterium]|nr:CoA transferase [Cellvibrionales bacterium]